jgi:hypothetical protein
MIMRSILILALLCLASGGAAAQPDEQQNQGACMSDAMTVCGQFIPNRERVAGCLISNRHRISAPCRAQLAHWHG